MQELAMESRAKLFGHPLHQQLVALPLGMLALGGVLDLLGLFGALANAGPLAYWAIGIGIVAGLVAAAFGLIDLVAIPPGTRAARIGRLHGVGNVVVLALFVGSWALRHANGNDQAPPPFALVLSFGALALALLTAWLGGELVTRLGIGVSDGAHVDAPSSLDGPVPRSGDAPAGVSPVRRTGTP
jgi:uncharacterized membrane protein